MRTPAVRNVTFEVFHPLPYLVEGAALLLMALAMTRAPRDLRLEDHPLAAIAACVAASGSLILIVQSEALVGDFAKDVVAATYRLSSALLFILWAERLFRLGARRAACAYALSLVAGAALLAALSFCPLAIGKAALATLPVLSMGLLLSLRGKHGANQQECIDGVEESPLDESLPALKTKSKRDAAIAATLLFVPLVMRGPFISVQSSWIDQQNSALASLLLQMSMAASLLMGCGLVALLIRFLWNKRCIMFFELIIVPLSLLAFYAAQASESLWFIYIPIIDATYKALLLFVILMPFLTRAKRPFALAPLGLGILIVGRVPFSLLVTVLPATAYAGLSVVFVTLGIVGSITALLASGMFEDEKPEAGLPLSNAPEQDAATDRACDILARRHKLTGREREVLGLLARHYNAPYIAKKLVLSPSTVKTHMRNLYAKLEVHSQSDLYLLVEQTAQNPCEECHDR